VAYSVVASAGAKGTTAGIDTTGATLIVLFVHQDTAAQGVSDSKGNTWTSLTSQTGGVSGTNNTGRLWYCVNPTVGSGHTFSAAVAYGAIAALALAGNAAVPFDQENGSGSTSSVTSRQPGSITPSEDDCIVVAGTGIGGSNSNHAIDGGFTIAGDLNGISGTQYGGFIAYLIQTSATAANPTSSWTTSNVSASVIASFKAAAGGGGGSVLLLRLQEEGLFVGSGRAF
jgi:hypothetical protein